MFLKFLQIGFILFLSLTQWSSKGYCSFDPHFGVSLDNGVVGDVQIAQWLVSKGYYSDFSLAKDFADNGYIGHDGASADPYFFQINQPFSIRIEQEIAGFANFNILGSYTGSDSGKSLTQIFGGTENGPKILSINQPFGLYLSTPLNNWYTDRHENILQQGGLFQMIGGNPQSLIYELKPGHEWLVAWEDLDTSRLISDRDYNDMYVRVTVVPEPVNSVLYILGGLALAVVAGLRRKFAV